MIVFDIPGTHSGFHQDGRVLREGLIETISISNLE